MPGFNVLKHTHTMIGLPFLEWHDYLIPPGLPTPPKAGHTCFAIIAAGPWGFLTGQKNDEGPNKTVQTDTSTALSVTTDAGPLIPHLNIIPLAPPNLLIPVFLLASGSKSHFGASTVLFPKGPAAFAVAIKVNFNLNCAGATLPPLPSGLVIAMPQTVEVGVTMGDLIGGIVHLVLDALIQFGLNRALKGLGGVFS
jgi:hypothetical protein